MICATPCNRQQSLGDRIVDEPRQLLLAHSGGADRVIDDRTPVDVDSFDLRLQDSLWQFGTHACDSIAHVAGGAIHRRADLKLDDGLCDPLGRPRGDVLDVADVGYATLDLLQNLRLDLGGAAPGSLIVTCTNGAEMSGFSVIGRRAKATMPNTVSTANSTSGKTGCVIAQADNRLIERYPFGAAGHGRSRFVGRISGGPCHRNRFADPQKRPGDCHHALIAVKAAADEQTLGASSRYVDLATLELIVGGHEQHVGALLVAEDGRLRQNHAGAAADMNFRARKRALAQILIRSRQRDPHRPLA